MFQTQSLIAYAINQALHYRTNNIILTMGDDFQYTAAAVNFYSMDKLIKLVYNIIYTNNNILFCIRVFDCMSVQERLMSKKKNK